MTSLAHAVFEKGQDLAGGIGDEGGKDDEV
jgi:hypothetical protein